MTQICLEESNEEIYVNDAHVLFENHVIRFENLRLNLNEQEKICQHLKGNYLYNFELLNSSLGSTVQHTRNFSKYTTHNLYTCSLSFDLG